MPLVDYTAFQHDAFQNDAFQTYVETIVDGVPVRILRVRVRSSVSGVFAASESNVVCSKTTVSSRVYRHRQMAIYARKRKPIQGA